MISIFAPDGMGEVTPETALAEEVVRVVAADPAGPLRDGDIVVVTSKIVSKLEGRLVAADQRAESLVGETVRTVARRGAVTIVQTRHGLVQAAAGIDNSNVAPGQLLLLPVDPDDSARRLRAELAGITQLRVGVIISDTAGRAWRLGQTDHAIGAAGVKVINSYAGRHDPYGNLLQVTEIALADELAAAADLVKAKLAGRPVAVIRGLADHVLDDDSAAGSARDLVRNVDQDFFHYGVRESVIAAVLTASGQPDRIEEILAIDDDHELVAAVLAATEPSGAGRAVFEQQTIEKVLLAALGQASSGRSPKET